VFDQDFLFRPIQVRPVGLEPTTFGFVDRLSDATLFTIVPQYAALVNESADPCQLLNLCCGAIIFTQGITYEISRKVGERRLWRRANWGPVSVAQHG
jgi:hypothetical protein